MDWRDRTTRMALTLGPAILVLLTFVALLVSVILHAITIDELKFSDLPEKHFDTNVIIGDKPEELVWFLQVTDLHLSCRGNPERESDFVEFSKSYIDIIKPDAVLVTGDITDGRKANTSFGTGPQLQEWLSYNDAVVKSNAPNKTAWLDIRGNHDNFNVYRPEDPNTLYRQYSIQGKLHERNYYHILEKYGKNYTFIGVDEVQTPGLKIPFNFIGLVKDEDLTELKRFKEISKEYNSQYNVWFAHYPTSSIASPNEGLRNIIDGPYLCGHFHTIGNLVTKMHATQQPGFAELELGDWKYNRRVRLAAIDHQLFSFVDVGFKQFPIALMTNPRRPQYSMPKYEPVDRALNSTHIRVIAFSNASITKVELSIDGKPKHEMRKISDGPLYVMDWNPKEYSKGLHDAQIYVSDAAGKNIIYSESFSLDNTKEDFDLGAKVLLRAYFKSCVMSIFFFVVVICNLPMIVLKIVSYKHEEVSLKRHYKGTFLYNLHLLSNIDRLFWPLVIVPTWMAVGPHFVGYMVDEAIGACFVWGVLIDGRFIHTGITYNVGSIFLLLIHVPIVILLTNQCSSSYNSMIASNLQASIINIRLLAHIAITALQLYMGSLLISAYGLMSFFTSFPFFWSIFIYGYCWFQCTTLDRSDFLKFNNNENHEEQQALTSQTARDDKSSTSDHSTCLKN